MMSGIDKHDNLGAKKDEEIDICVNSKDDSVTKRPASEVSDSNKRYQTLQRRKNSGIIRLYNAEKHLTELLSVYDHKTEHRNSKISILRTIKKVRSEYRIIEEIITSIKTTIAISEDEETDADKIIDNLDKELTELANEADLHIKRANDQLDERIFNGEKDSEVSSDCYSKASSITTTSKASKISSTMRRQQEWKEAHERLNRLEQEQLALEEDINKKTNMFQQNQRIIEDARSIVSLNEGRAKASLQEEQKTIMGEKTPPPTHENPVNPQPQFKASLQEEQETKIGMTTSPPNEEITTPTQKFPVNHQPRLKQVKLKGVQLPTFSGEDKTKFEPWYAAFASVVDETDIPVKEKMLRLQGCLNGKALETVRDFGFSNNAYERAKEKLKRKYGGKRRQTLTHLTTLRGLPKVRRHNLADMEELLAVLDRILISLQDGDPDGEMRSQHLNLTVKEKLPEEDIRAYKYWLYEHEEDDSFEKLVQWIETRVQIMDEALEETGEFNKRRQDKRFNRGFNTMGSRRKCIVDKCTIDHPPWVCSKFKELSVTQRKELIAKTGRCFRCLAAGHRSKNCPRSKKCGIYGCESSGHSNFLHDSNRYKSGKGAKASQKPNGELADQESPAAEDKTNENSTKTYAANQVENISLMVLPADVMNGPIKLRVNVMLDPCSTGSYITENAAEELQLEGRMQNLTISGTAGTEVKKLSQRVELSIASVSDDFCAPLEANVLEDITGNTPAIKWNEIKNQWPHLKHIPFQNVAKRPQIDLLIGSDHPVFHQVRREVQRTRTNDPVAR